MRCTKMQSRVEACNILQSITALEAEHDVKACVLGYAQRRPMHSAGRKMNAALQLALIQHILISNLVVHACACKQNHGMVHTSVETAPSLLNQAG